MNGSCWTSARKVVMQSPAWVIAVEEHKLISDEEIAEASAGLRRAGWKSFWSAGAFTDKGGRTGGVALLAREELGLEAPPGGAELVPGRLVAGFVELGRHKWAVFASYFEVNTGLGKVNTSILGEVGGRAQEWRLPWILAADFNMKPELLAASGFAGRAGAAIRAPRRPTFIAKKASTTIDFFLVSKDLLSVVGEATVLSDAKTSPHRPVVLSITRRFRQVTKQVLVKPRRLPAEEVFGPRPAPIDWAPALAALEAAEKFLCGDAGTYDAALTEAYAAFSNTMEEEIEAATGSLIEDRGARAQLPRLKTVPALPGGRREEEDGWRSLRRPARWLGNRVREFLGLLAGSSEIPTSGRDTVVEQFLCLADELRHESPEEIRQHADLNAVHSAILVITEAVATDISNMSGTSGSRQRAQEIGEQLLEAAAVISDKEMKTEGKEARARWMEWAEEAALGGAGALHRFTRLPKAWSPTTVKIDSSGRTSASPGSLLSAEAARLKGLWRCSSAEPPIDDEVLEHLGLIPTEKIKRVARSYRIFAATARDGWHLRHFGMLSEAGLLVLQRLLALIERRSLFPRQLRLVQIFLVEKPKGGYRSLGLFSALYRLWTRCRRTEAVAWELEHVRAYAVYGPGGSCVDAVWRQGVRAEAAKKSGGAAASLLWDLREYYEHLCRTLLQHRARTSGFPRQLVKAAVVMHGAARVVTLATAAVPVGHATSGFVAGDSLATTVIQVYTLDPMDNFTMKHTAVSLQIFIDDFLLQCCGRTEEFVENKIFEAAKDLVPCIEDELGCTVHTGKAEVVASSAGLLARVRRRMGVLSGSGEGHAVNLGISYASGMRRSTFWKRSAQVGRANLGGKRARRTWRLKRAIGNKVARLISTGTAPSMLYGAEVYGMSNKEVIIMRGWLLRPTCRRRKEQPCRWSPPSSIPSLGGAWSHPSCSGEPKFGERRASRLKSMLAISVCLNSGPPGRTPWLAAQLPGGMSEDR